jgi:hypothetical protein
MNKRTAEFRVPRLRDGVGILWRDGVAVLEYREQGCELDFPAEVQPELRGLLDLLKKGTNVGTLELNAPSLCSELPDFLVELDRLGLVVETDVGGPRGGLKGAEFYRQLRRFATKVTQDRAKNLFYHRLSEGKVAKCQLVGYALEYYHLVKYAPRLIGPALAHTGTERTQNVLVEFLTSELGHDRMLLESLEAVGIRLEHLEHVMPLPSTFALITALGVFASQDPLSFKSALFVYEEADQRFGFAFEKQCQQLGMPAGFYEPILRHGAVNDDYSHGDITKILLSEVAFVSAEEQIVVKKHVANLIETLVGMETEILEYYSDSKVLPAVT